MEKLSKDWFGVAITILLVGLLVIVSTYLRDKNQIEAKTNRAECFHRAFNLDKAFYDQATNVCIDINSYKIKSEDWDK